MSVTSYPAPLSPSERLPVLFVGHGSPMNVIDDNPFRDAWHTLGDQFGKRWPRPRLILCISAHWLTHGWWITAMAQPKTIHDFGGFPQALFDQQYPAPGAPEAARAIASAVGPLAGGKSVGLDDGQWGLDHGAWGVLKPMFPAADIPVLQLSMDGDAAPAAHFEVGQRLRPLRDQGVLVVASGNIVHNLRTMRRDAGIDQAYDWAIEFDAHVGGLIERGELAALAEFESQGPAARLSQPSTEHFLPLLYAAGAAEPGEPAAFFNERFQLASVGMRSVIWG